MNDQPRAQIDTAQFDRLLVMAGPVLAASLIAQLQTDLSTAQHKLQGAAQPLDWMQIQAQSHVVMGLAATMGAENLRQLAKGLNDMAHHPVPDLQISTAQVTDIGQAIDVALAFLSQFASGARVAR